MPAVPAREEVVVNLLLTIFDLSGTFAFAISGAIAGARHKLVLTCAYTFLY